MRLIEETALQCDSFHVNHVLGHDHDVSSAALAVAVAVATVLLYNLLRCYCHITYCAAIASVVDAGQSTAEPASSMAQDHSPGQQRVLLQPLHWASKQAGVPPSAPGAGRHPV